MSEPRSPLEGIAELGRARLVAGEAGVAIAERRPGSICEIAGWPDTRERLSVQLAAALKLRRSPTPGRLVATKGVLALGVAPGRFQAIAKDPGLADGLAQAIDPADGAVVDLSHARGGVRVFGPAAQELLQKGLDLDLDPAAFAAMSAVQSAIHHMPVTVLRLDAETFDLFTFRGFAVSLWEWLTDGSVEYGWRAAPPVS